MEVSLPKYDLSKTSDRAVLLEWLGQDKPTDVFIASPYTVWSRIETIMQKITRNAVKKRRNQEMTFFKMIFNIFKMRYEEGLHTTM
jgi:hypothetical protein